MRCWGYGKRRYDALAQLFENQNMKRFTETQKWEDPWFRRLRPEMKLLWQWLCDKCDNAGIIDPDLELASFQIGYQYPSDTLLEFGERVVLLDCRKALDSVLYSVPMW
tara:strand:- start:558 stop:881 length:324 start_codon:yes stop_codon:yes gene_type:complete